MRIPYVPDPPPINSPEEQDIVDRIRQRRGERGLTKLDLALLHSPPVADGWNGFMDAIRNKTSLPADLRELAICRVAVLCEATYEWQAHAPIAIASGISEETMEALKSKSIDRRKFNEQELVVIDFVDAVVTEPRVPDEIFSALKNKYTTQQVLEFTVTVSAYITTAKTLTTLDIGEKNDRPI